MRRFILLMALLALNGQIILSISNAARAAGADDNSISNDGSFRASVVIISGDGGWGEIEKDLAAGFGVQRLPVARIDSSDAFSSEHPASEIARDVEALVHDAPQVILVGYSFGADLIPLIWPELSESSRHRIVTISLIAPTHYGSTVIDPTDRYDPTEIPMVALAEHHARLPADRLVCVFGTQERTSGITSCPTPSLAKSHVIEVDGGHELGGQALRIASEITRFARNRAHALAGFH